MFTARGFPQGVWSGILAFEETIEAGRLQLQRVDDAKTDPKTTVRAARDEPLHTMNCGTRSIVRAAFDGCGMIKLVTFLKRKPPLTRPGFAERWLTIHAPMAAVFPGLRGYMLSFPVAAEAEEPSADGVAQLWFDSEEAAQESYATDIGRSGSKDASGNLTRREHLFASERWISAPASLGNLPYKLLVAGKRLSGVERSDFASRWEEAGESRIAPLVEGRALRVCVDRRGKMLNSGTSGALGLVDGEPVHDGLIEIWCEGPTDLTRLAEKTSAIERALEGVATGLEILAMRENVIVKPPAPAYGTEN
jgi:uncharacterized protein (TIGR02118 family)